MPSSHRLVAVFAVTLVTFTFAFELDLQFTCHPNDTIVALNPAADALQLGFANSSSSECDVTFFQNFTYIHIDGCDKGLDILLHLGNAEDSVIVGGIQERWYLLRCDEIQSAGVERILVNGFTPLISTFQSTAKFTVTSALRLESATGPVVWLAHLTTVLVWTFDVPAVYDAVPLNCVAFGGRPSDSVFNKTIIVDGCSVKPDLVGNFGEDQYVLVRDNLVKRYYTRLTVFKFYNSNVIIIRCSVRICRSGHPNCSFDCSLGRKKRRSEADEDTALEQTSVTLNVVSRERLVSSAFRNSSSVWALVTVLLGRGLTRP